jgi:RNA polymerase sigma factor (sigma-70 family)
LLGTRTTPFLQPEGNSLGSSGESLTAAAWLESPYLPRAVRRVALRYSLREEDVADLVQEVRVVLLQIASDRLLNATWIFHTVGHKAADMVRRRIRSAAGEGAAAVPAPPAALSPELVHLLRAKVSLLPPKLRTFYELRYEEGLSQRDVARRLGACRASVRWLERQCLRRIGRGLFLPRA